MGNLRRWLPGGRNKFRNDIGDELRAHMDELTQENIRAGMNAEEARRAAALRFGNLSALSDSVQQERRVFRFEQLIQDLRFGLRMFRKAPAFTLVAIITLALGIGGTTAIFSVVNNVLLKPLAFRDPGKVVILFSVSRGMDGYVSSANYLDWKQQATTVDAMSASQLASFTFESNDTPERVTGTRVTANYFDTLGVAPLMGRTFTEAEDQPGNNVVVISERLWRNRLGADPNIVGRSIRLSSRVYSVVGVMPASFDPMFDGPRLWVPMAFTPEQRARYDSHSLLVLARMKPGVSLSQTQSEMEKVARVQQQRAPKENNMAMGARFIRAQKLTDAIFEDHRPSLYMLLGAVGFVLLIACLNVGTLQLARARARVKELAIRSALGASSSRIVRQLLAESFLLALIGGVCGLGVARILLRVIVDRAPESIPRIATASLDLAAVAFSLVMVLLAAAVSGAWAAIRARHTDPGSELAAGRTSGSLSSRDRLRGAMVVVEVALSVVLLVGAGLLIRSAMAVNNTDLGFDASHLLVGRVGLPQARYTSAELLRTAFRRVAEETRAIPGVQSAALVNRTPMVGISSNGMVPEGAAPGFAVQADLRIITPSYFDTIRLPLLAGRAFTDADTFTAPHVLIINQKFADLAWPGQNPIGKHVQGADPAEKTVVGVVGDIHAHGLTEQVYPEFYLPMEQVNDEEWGWNARAMEAVVRFPGEPAALAGELRSVMKRIDPSVPVYGIASMEDRIGATLARRRFTTFLLTSFAALALFLAAIGIYGVVSYSVTQRTQEIGVRMALGAKRGQVLRMIVGHAIGLVGLGTVIGLAGAFGVSRFMATLLFHVAPTDPASFVVAPVVLLLLALLASYIPAARAMRIDPVVALR